MFVGLRIERLLTDIEPEKLTGVDGLMATAFQPEFVIITDCELPGRTPRDQFAVTSQLPLPALIQEFTCAEAEMDAKAMSHAKKHNSQVGWMVTHFMRWSFTVGTPRAYA